MSLGETTAATFATMRAISRACAEVGGAYMRAFDKRHSRTYIYCTLLSGKASSGHEPADGQSYAAYSIRSLSTSLKIPFETARLATKYLIARGLCEMDGPLVRATPGGTRHPAIRAANATVVRETANILTTLAELSRGRIPPLPLNCPNDPLRAPPSDAQEELWVSIFLRFMIRMVEINSTTVDDAFDGLVLGTIQTLNVMDYPIYKETVLDFCDADRRPVSIRTIADKLGSPRETVRRHCNALEGLGLIHYVERKGWVVLRSQVEKLSLGPQGYAQIMIGLGRMVEDLRKTNFPAFD